MAEKFNKGDVSEGILAAAITARFVSKTKSVNQGDVLAIIGKLKSPSGGAKGLTTLTKFPSPNLKKGVIDTVVCKVNLAAVNMKAFLNKNIYKDKDVAKLVAASVQYANGKYVREWADMMYTNGQKNIIEVNSEGLLDQSGTKVDLRVIIDGTRSGIGISLKAGDVKQFGQVGGGTIASMHEFFGSLGVKFTSADVKTFDAHIAKKAPAKALVSAYKSATGQLQNIIRKDPNQFKKNLAAFMRFHATRNEPNVALVQLNRGQATVYMFEQLRGKLKGVPVRVEYRDGTTNVIPGAKIPQISIYGGEDDTSSNLLLLLRVKLEGNRINSKGKRMGLTIRNYVEKGALTTQLVSDH